MYIKKSGNLLTGESGNIVLSIPVFVYNDGINKIK